jgi:ribonuclease-3
MIKPISDFEKKIGVDFQDKDLIEKAFIHRSYVNESGRKNLEHNERIEFLGDAVLELSTTEFLYKKFPEKKEGEMTSLRSALVNTDSLGIHAAKLNMGDYLFMSRGEKASVKGRDHILANTFEAVIGAIYLDQGFASADNFLKKNLFGYIDEVIENDIHRDSKSFFQEQAQEHTGFTPEYRVMKQMGPDHDRIFVSGVFLGEGEIARGEGTSKQKAEIDAAKNGLVTKKWN